MEQTDKQNQLLAEALHLQDMEGNPLDKDDLAMFEMFEREGFTAKQRRDYILAQAKTDQLVPAAQ